MREHWRIEVILLWTEFSLNSSFTTWSMNGIVKEACMSDPWPFLTPHNKQERFMWSIDWYIGYVALDYWATFPCRFWETSRTLGTFSCMFVPEHTKGSRLPVMPCESMLQFNAALSSEINWPCFPHPAYTPLLRPNQQLAMLNSNRFTRRIIDGDSVIHCAQLGRKNFHPVAVHTVFCIPHCPLTQHCEKKRITFAHRPLRDFGANSVFRGVVSFRFFLRFVLALCLIVSSVYNRFNQVPRRSIIWSLRMRAGLCGKMARGCVKTS